MDMLIKRILGFDVNILTKDDKYKTISFSNLKNVSDNFISLATNRSNEHPISDYYHVIDLHMRCNGYNIDYKDYKANGGEMMIAAKIKEVNIIVPGKVVEVAFADGTKEKSVCKGSDVFSLESAISICISKKIMGGSSAYNNAVKRGMKVYEEKLKKETAEKEEQERIEKKRAKRLAYKKKREAKRAEEENQRKAREREEQIAVQTEAYLRAMDIMRNENRGV